MSKAIDTEVPALRTRIRNLEKALDAQTKLVLEMTEKATEAVTKIRILANVTVSKREKDSVADVADIMAEILGVK